MAKITLTRTAELPSDVYDTLYHYTTATGLLGILESNCLWATNYSYLNDREEVWSFLDRLPSICSNVVRQGVEEFYKTDSSRRDLIKSHGGVVRFSRQIVEQIVDSFERSFKRVNEPYMTSFCGAENEDIAKNGLLSQWRAYGADGGYAIGFDTKGLEELLHREDSSYPYSFLALHDVNYNPTTPNPKLPEFEKYQADLIACLERYISTGRAEELQGTYRPLTAMACTTKHYGFHEEREVRIIAVPACEAIVEKYQKKKGVGKPRRLEFNSRYGVLIPHIPLFKGMSTLPIKQIIIGPCSYQRLRKKSLELLLSQKGIQAEVFCSNIPYVE